MKRGVSIMFINGLVVAVVLLFSFGVDVTNRLVHQRYDQTVSSQRALIACNNASKVFQQQSDELTLHVNNYVETDSTDALLAYFAIIDNQSREHEIEIAEQYDVDCTTLKQALALSDALAEREIHAFALMAAARGNDPNRTGSGAGVYAAFERTSTSGRRKESAGRANCAWAGILRL